MRCILEGMEVGEEGLAPATLPRLAEQEDHLLHHRNFPSVLHGSLTTHTARGRSETVC